MPAAHPRGAYDQADGTGVVAIIGTGFGGAVVARRLAQANRALQDKRLRIVLLERGRRYEAEDFPRIQLPEYLTEDATLSSSKRLPEAARMAWSHDQGLWQIRDLGGLRVALSAGYGGGSLIYASVHLRPPAEAFDHWPGGYSRDTLDPYYQLAEAMLDVKLAPQDRWLKTRRMDETATALNRKAEFFRPPIAVTFDDTPTDPNGPRVTRDNGFGVQQSGCIGCGDCIIGCPNEAKNTLDHNYLAGIEEMGVEVRTLCEASRIERIAPADKERGRFRLVYRDHLKGAEENRLAAEYVFVCAGAVGSTELLFRSCETLDGHGTSTGLASLGKRFFANGDAPGVIFGTREKWEPTKGPTITTSMYYAEQGQSFLLQEGGIPPNLERGLGFLQSPLWFKGNAFGKPASSRSAGSSERTLAGLHELSNTALSVPRLSRELAVAARFPELSELAAVARDAIDDPKFAAVLDRSPELAAAVRDAVKNPHLVPSLASVPDLSPELTVAVRDTIEDTKYAAPLTNVTELSPELAAAVRDGVIDRKLAELLARVPELSHALTSFVLDKAGTEDVNLPRLLPQSFRALVEPFDPPGEKFREHITSLDRGVVDRFANALGAGIPLVGWVVACLVKWIGHKPEVVQATIAELVHRFAALATVRDSTSAPMLGIHTFIDLVLGPPPTDSTAILLAMGSDSRWTLTWNRDSRQLQGKGNTTANVELYGMQERLMRDVALSLGGELRTNPGWTLGKSPITVHAQGGCSMGNGDGVTDPNGLMVRGVDGLYVFDASVFPHSVGVNPSNTIAAVSERNIELFIRTVLAERAPVLKQWTAVAAEEERLPTFRQRLERKQKQWDEEPGRILDHTKTPAPSKIAVPGLVFNEVMEGFIGNVEGTPPRLDPPADIETGKFRDLERRGQRLLQHMRLAMTACIPDVDKAFLNPERFSFALGGLVTISWAPPSAAPGERVVRTRPTEYAVDRGTLVVDLRARNGVGTMKYRLKAIAMTNTSDWIQLRGVKQLREDPGLDAWKDLTTLYVRVERHTANGGRPHGGIVRVPLLDLLGTQLPSMDINGDDISPERKSWLQLKFVMHFFRGLGRIYTFGEL